MLVRDAKAIARDWIVAEAAKLPGFGGAYLAGSTTWLPADAALPTGSDVDVMVVLDDPTPPQKLGKFVYRGVLLEVSYLPADRLESPAQVLADYHLAGSLRTPSVVLDPTGRLTALQAAVSRDFAKRQWVVRRCEHARSRIATLLRQLNEAAAPFHDQVTTWLFATGITTHVLLTAGLRNPTVRLRYVAARDLLADYGRLDVYPALLALLGCAALSRPRVEQHLSSLTAVFDVAKTRDKTPFFFASDISDAARPIAIDGSRALIARGDQREAVFWIVATYSRCLKILFHAAPDLYVRFLPGYRALLGDLGITSLADLQRRGAQVSAFLPRLWAVTGAILTANPGITD